jgi:hypothetical protein
VRPPERRLRQSETGAASANVGSGRREAEVGSTVRPSETAERLGAFGGNDDEIADDPVSDLGDETANLGSGDLVEGLRV